ncbi:MAG: hypothetical protein ABW133_17830 [Polyangiaceae bacterium]
MRSTKTAFRIFIASSTTALNLLSQACSSGTCGAHPCTAVELEAAATGTIVVAEEGKPAETFHVEKDCFVSPFRFAPIDAAQTVIDRTRGWFFSCEARGRTVTVGIAEDFDPRLLESAPASGDTNSKSIVVRGWEGPPGSPMYVAHGGLTLDVVEAVGSAKPYPELVSFDYRRRFRLKSEATAEDGAGPVIAVDLELEQTAASVHAAKDASCPCE